MIRLSLTEKDRDVSSRNEINRNLGDGSTTCRLYILYQISYKSGIWLNLSIMENKIEAGIDVLFVLVMHRLTGDLLCG